MKISFNHYKKMIVDIGGSKHELRRSYKANMILQSAQVLFVVSAYPVEVDMNIPQIKISKLSLQIKRKLRQPELYFGCYKASKDIVMVGYEFFNGRDFSQKDTLFFKETNQGWQKMNSFSEELNDLKKAYQSVSILEGL